MLSLRFIRAFRLGMITLAPLLFQSCNHFDSHSFHPERIEAQPEHLLREYADTSRTLPRLAAMPARQQVDSFLYFAEWLKNYDEDISLVYAQQAYDIATEKNWNFPRAASAYRIAVLKGRKARFGEDIEDAMVDARISKRLLAPYENVYWQFDINNLMGFLFRKASQMDSARLYFEKALNAVDGLPTQEEVIYRNKAMILHNLGNTYFRQDSLKTTYYFSQSDSLFQLLGDRGLRARLWLDWGIFHQLHNAFPKADSFLNLCLDYGKRHEDVNLLALAYQEKGFLDSRKFKYYEKPEDFACGLQNLKECLNYAHDNDYRTYEILGNIFQDSWRVDIDESHADSAIMYYKLAMEEARKEGVIQKMKALSANISALYGYAGGLHQPALGEKLETFLDRNYGGVVDTITGNTKSAYQRINAVEQRDIKVNAANKRRGQLFISLAVLLVAALVFLFALQRQQNRRLKAEMEALRAQINPHFISNSLNAIENLVNMGHAEAASKYLVHFSRLSRQILNGSRSATTSLASELKTLEHFLALEQLRFRDKLAYDIQVSPEVDAEQAIVPAMILQPYVENAIWHGIKPKAEGGHVWISIEKEGKVLVCSIEDDGVGREKSRAMREASVLKHKSMGMQITEERLKSIGRIKGSHILIQDLEDESGQAAGTRVVLRLPYRLRKTQQS